METLSRIPLFADLPEAVQEDASRRCTWRSYDANELIIDYEDDSSDVRFIVSGHVRIILRVATGKEVILSEMGDGDYFGEIAAIDGSGRSANVTALSRSQVCIVPRALFMELVEKQPDVNRSVLSTLAARVRHLNMRLAEHCFLQTRHRLYNELLRLSRPRPGHPDQRSISPPPTQKDLAARIGTRREVVSREIASMKRQGIVDKTTGALVLCDLPRLNALISQGWDEAE